MRGRLPTAGNLVDRIACSLQPYGCAAYVGNDAVLGLGVRPAEMITLVLNQADGRRCALLMLRSSSALSERVRVI
jgi:hypothetical protein